MPSKDTGTTDLKLQIWEPDVVTKTVKYKRISIALTQGLHLLSDDLPAVTTGQWKNEDEVIKHGVIQGKLRNKNKYDRPLRNTESEITVSQSIWLENDSLQCEEHIKSPIISCNQNDLFWAPGNYITGIIVWNTIELFLIKTLFD